MSLAWQHIHGQVCSHTFSKTILSETLLQDKLYESKLYGSLLPALSYCVYLFVDSRLISAESPLVCIAGCGILFLFFHILKLSRSKFKLGNSVEVRTTLIRFAVAVMDYHMVKSNLRRKGYVSVYNSQVTPRHPWVNPGRNLRQELKWKPQRNTVY